MTRFNIGDTVYTTERPLFTMQDGLLWAFNVGSATVEDVMTDSADLVWHKVRFARSGMTRWYQSDQLSDTAPVYEIVDLGSDEAEIWTPADAPVPAIYFALLALVALLIVLSWYLFGVAR